MPEEGRLLGRTIAAGLDWTRSRRVLRLDLRRMDLGPGRWVLLEPGPGQERQRARQWVLETRLLLVAQERMRLLAVRPLALVRQNRPVRLAGP